MEDAPHTEQTRRCGSCLWSTRPGKLSESTNEVSTNVSTHMNAHQEEGSRDAPYAAKSAVGATLLCLLKLCSKRRRAQ